MSGLGCVSVWVMSGSGLCLGLGYVWSGLCLGLFYVWVWVMSQSELCLVLVMSGLGYVWSGLCRSGLCLVWVVSVWVVSVYPPGPHWRPFGPSPPHIFHKWY